eukprot:CAMPEP_0198310390 /NCGR_PEP_ID=MMETSP1450-20131203/2494_1 /TAXON_ID=753684 ORGANISM="Madagascaria erythrocladiodes, Strain CCMP3234" /NCGR_SAMPLE_ID=MMETSP1450 /ASSEMBLY_ACC=CAM_ASM_001115 /LENGTH=152 /DNA_ID=CAMNT_0044013215 /DNA_START=102 /DNA_END=560 /DNA_ORIENTATION=+
MLSNVIVVAAAALAVLVLVSTSTRAGMATTEQQAEKRNVEQGFLTQGAYGGIVFQQNPGAQFNVSLTVTPAGTGTMAFYNPALYFRCLGTVQHVQGNHYTYSKVLSRSNPANLCAEWGNLVVNPPAGGFVQLAFYPNGQPNPAFNVYLFQYV